MNAAILKDCEEAKALAAEWRKEEKQLLAAMEKKEKEQQMQHIDDDE